MPSQVLRSKNIHYFCKLQQYLILLWFIWKRQKCLAFESSISMTAKCTLLDGQAKESFACICADYGDHLSFLNQFPPGKNLGYLSLQTDVDGHFLDGCLIQNMVHEDSGSVVIVARGGCSFAQKARIAQASSAKGLIIVDYPENEENVAPAGLDDKAEPPVLLPVVSISYSTSEWLKQRVQAASHQTSNTMAKAIVVCLELKTFNSQNPLTWYYEGLALNKEKKYKEAADAFSKSLTFLKTFSPAVHELANALHNLNHSSQEVHQIYTSFMPEKAFHSQLAAYFNMIENAQIVWKSGVASSSLCEPYVPFNTSNTCAGSDFQHTCVKDAEFELRAVAVATQTNKSSLKTLAQDFKAINCSFDILGQNMTYGGRGGLKLLLMYNYLQALSPEERKGLIILFVDAYDVMLAPCLQQEHIFQRFFAFDAPIVIGAERQCWPDPSSAVLHPSTKDYQERSMIAPTFPFLNSGIYIGYADALNQAFNWIISLIKEELIPSGLQVEEADDQRWLMKYSLMFPNKAQIDTEGVLALNLHKISQDSLVFQKEKSIFFTDTGTFPLMFHGNGGGKQLFYDLMCRYKDICDADSSSNLKPMSVS